MDLYLVCYRKFAKHIVGATAPGHPILEILSYTENQIAVIICHD